MTTKAQAKQRAGELLRLVPIGQDLQNQDDARMGDAYDEIYALLQVKGVAVWETDMPDEVAEHVIYMMARNKMDLYGVSDSLYSRIMNKVGFDYEKALANLRNLLNPSYQTSDPETDY